MAAPAPELFPENLNKNNNLCLYISLPDPSHEKIVSLFDEFALSMHCSPCEEKNCRYHLILKDKSEDKGENFPNQVSDCNDNFFSPHGEQSMERANSSNSDTNFSCDGSGRDI